MYHVYIVHVIPSLSRLPLIIILFSKLKLQWKEKDRDKAKAITIGETKLDLQSIGSSPNFYTDSVPVIPP